MNDEQLVPLADEPQPSGFDVVLRGYDRRQVDDYLDRVEVALNDADARHAEDAGRLTALEQEVADLRQRLVESERRADGRPEPVPIAGDRIAAMLRLADEEATALRAAAAEEAHRIVAEAHELAGQETAKRTAELDQRERDIAGAHDQAEATRLEAQRDAEGIRQQAEQEAAEVQARAQDELRTLHEAGQLEAAAMTAEARRQVEDLSRQRDAIAAQLQSLRDTLSGAVGPLSTPGRDADATQAMRLPDDTRTEPGA